jgi:hypothetical protein
MKKLWLVVAAIVSLSWVQPVTAGVREDAFLKELQEELHRRGDPWVAGKTPVSHLSFEEKKKLCNMPLISERERHPERERLSRVPKNPPPPEMDWRNHEGENWMTTVKNQGDTCGCCWAFNWVSAQEARMKIFRGELVEDYDLSEQFVVSCNPQGYGCSGGTNDIGNWVQQDGIPSDDCYPYAQLETDVEAPCGDRCGDWEARVTAIGGLIDDWGETPYPDAAALKAEVMNGPTAIGVEWPEAKNGEGGGVREDFFFYKSGVYEPVLGEWIKAGHGICCCGWNSGGQWLIKNQWTVYWGDGGYGYIDYSVWWNTWMIPSALTVPRVVLYEYATSEDVWDIDEQTDLVLTLRNAGASATNAQATISIPGSDPYITIDVATSNLGDIGTGITVDNSSSPFKLTSSAATPRGHLVPIDVEITADGGYSRSYSFTLFIVFMPCKAFETFDNPPCPGDTCITYGLAYDGTANLYMTEFYSPFIYKFSKDGTYLASISAPEDLGGATGIDYDGKNDCLWVTNGTTKMVYQVSPTDGSIISAFQSPATQYPTGLAFDGTDLWIVDRDANTIYQCATDGSVLSSFVIPVTSNYGPRGLAFDTTGATMHGGAGTLILFVTHWNLAVDPPDLDSCAIYEMKRDGTLIPEHRCVTPGGRNSNGRMVCVDPEHGTYWVDGGQRGPVSKITGFHYTGHAVEERKVCPKVSSLTILPNPTRRETSISFHMSGAGKVGISIYDVTGKLVSRLVNKDMNAGRHEVSWRGTNTKDKDMPSGVYFCQIEALDFSTTRKLILMR